VPSVLAHIHGRGEGIEARELGAADEACPAVSATACAGVDKRSGAPARVKGSPARGDLVQRRPDAIRHSAVPRPEAPF
jgi:hypothetical protein